MSCGGWLSGAIAAPMLGRTDDLKRPTQSSRLRMVLLCLMGWAVMGAGQAQEPVVPADSRFVMSFFKANTSGGDERLYIAVSPDGQHWTALNGGQPVWQDPLWPSYMVRDPTIVFHKGYYWVAHTSGYYGRHPVYPSFGLLRSKDLLNWTKVGEIDTSIPGMTDPFTWNPCFFKDSDGSLHVFVSISPINGNTFYPVPEMRTYELHPLNDDLTEWSAPAVVELPHSNTNEFWAWKDGDTYHAVYVSFAAHGQLVHTTSEHLLTGWGNERILGFHAEEGIFVLKKPDGGYRLYSETGNGTATGYMWRDTDPQFKTFTAPTLTVTDTPMRNGKTTALAGFLSYDTWRASRMADLPPAESERDADPDQDGMSNFLEYAFDLNPRETSSAPFQLTEGGPAGMTLKWRRAPSRKDAQIAPQFSSDLQSWDAAPAGFTIQSVTLMTDGTEEIQAKRTAGPGLEAAGFVRLQVAGTAEAKAAALLETPAELPTKKLKKLQHRAKAAKRQARAR